MRRNTAAYAGLNLWRGIAVFLLAIVLINASSIKISASSEGLSAVIPQYDGNLCIALNNNVPFFTDGEKSYAVPFEMYSELDELGRCGVAYANICKELMPTEARGSIGGVRPSGWHTVKYNGLIDGNYLYNRCHLIAYQLAGENANEKNLITGTRYLNTQGMLPYENLVANYVNTIGNHVLYRVTPVFEGNNLVATGVEIEAWSVEDGGAGICFNIFCYNVQPGIGIEYSTGDSWLTEEGAALLAQNNAQSAAQAQTQNAAQNNTQSSTQNTAQNSTQSSTQNTIQNNTAPAAVTCNYIANTNTGKFHLPNCSSVSAMAEHNKLYFNGTFEQLVAQGFVPCQRCLKYH